MYLVVVVVMMTQQVTCRPQKERWTEILYLKMWRGMDENGESEPLALSVHYGQQ
jgi:hypothetical protein